MPADSINKLLYIYFYNYPNIIIRQLKKYDLQQQAEEFNLLWVLFTSLGTGEQRTDKWKKTKKTRASLRVAGLSLKDRVKSSVTRKGLSVELLFLHTEERQMRRFRYLARTPPRWGVPSMDNQEAPGQTLDALQRLYLYMHFLQEIIGRRDWVCWQTATGRQQLHFLLNWLLTTTEQTKMQFKYFWGFY